MGWEKKNGTLSLESTEYTRHYIIIMSASLQLWTRPLTFSMHLQLAISGKPFATYITNAVKMAARAVEFMNVALVRLLTECCISAHGTSENLSLGLMVSFTVKIYKDKHRINRMWPIWWQVMERELKYWCIKIYHFQHTQSTLRLE